MPAYDQLCRRRAPLTAEEGERLGWARFAAICRIREELVGGYTRPPPGHYLYLEEFSDEDPVVNHFMAHSYEMDEDDEAPTKAASLYDRTAPPPDLKLVDEHPSSCWPNATVDVSGDVRISKEEEQELPSTTQVTPITTTIRVSDISDSDEDAVMPAEDSGQSGESTEVAYITEDVPGCSVAMISVAPETQTSNVSNGPKHKESLKARNLRVLKERKKRSNAERARGNADD